MAQVRIEERSGPHTATDVVIVVQPSDSDQLREILLRQLPQMLELFIKKNSEYGSGEQSSGTALGSRGQYADIWRKIGKLKIGLWDDNEEQLTTESVDEILRDLIGHCFLALQLREFERQAEAGYEPRWLEAQKWHDAANQIQSEFRTVVRRLPDFSDDGISKSDIRSAAHLYPLTAQLLAQEAQAAGEPFAGLNDAEGRPPEDVEIIDDELDLDNDELDSREGTEGVWNKDEQRYED